MSTSTSDDDRSISDATETLLSGRERRANAGNRYNRDQIVAEAEDPQDEIALLFENQEVEDDEEFEESAEEDDHLSSSDDDDQGPNVAGDDLEGERQIQKEEKEQRSRKRKADLALTAGAGLRKRVRIDPRVSQPLAPKPTKKKERTFLLNDNENTRTSTRKQTLANTETIRTKLVEDEKIRLKHKARREKRNREKERDREKDMTQADRLADAERTERRNAKSFNRWEAREKERAEEQAAKLAALKDRKLEGPVLSVWSGVAKWVGPRKLPDEARDVSKDTPVEGKKRGRKSKAYHEQMAAMQRQSQQGLVPAPPAQDGKATVLPTVGEHGNLSSTSSTQDQQSQITFITPQGPDNFLEGLQQYAAEPVNAPASLPEIGVAATPTITAPLTPIDSLAPEVPPRSNEQIQPATPDEPPAPPIIEYATRNLVGLAKFEDLSLKDRNRYGIFFNHRKSAKPQRHIPDLCLITGLTANYRDPSTGVAYADSFAYHKLQELKRHEHTWSSMLGCYVGRAGFVARGVPDGFIG